MTEQPMFNKDTMLDPKYLKGRRIFLISDLHSGDGGPRDSFALYNGTERLNDFLDHFEAQTDNPALVILGDLFEWWQCSIGDTIQHNMDLLKRLKKLKAFYIIGNHDNDLLSITKLIKVPFINKMHTGTLIKRGGKKIALLHGHEKCPYNSVSRPSKGRAVCILGGVLEDLNGSPSLDGGKTTIEQNITKWGARLIHWFFIIVKKVKGTPSAKSGLTPSQYSRHAISQIKEFKKDQLEGMYTDLVCGHLHTPGTYQRWYHNTGSWHTKKCHFAHIGLDGKIDVLEWDPVNKKIAPCDIKISF